MSLFKRLLFYFFGFSIGLIFLFFFINKKEATFNYSPNKRVLADIQKKEWIFVSINDSSKIKKTNIINNFKVDFSKSNVELDSCKITSSKAKTRRINYIIELKIVLKKQPSRIFIYSFLFPSVYFRNY